MMGDEDDPIEAAIRRGSGGRVASPSVRQPVNASDDDPIEAAIRRGGGAAPTPVRGTPRPVGGKVESGFTALVSGLPGMEAMAGAISKLTGGTYQGGRRDISRVQGEAKQQLGGLPYEALRLVPETAASFTPLGGTTRMGRLMFAGGVEALRGAGRAGMERDEALGVGETAKSAAMSGTAGAAGSLIGEELASAASQIGRFTRVGRALGAAANMGRRAASDFLQSPTAQNAIPNVLGARTGAAALGRAVEPMDAITSQRIAQRTLPVTGETASGIKLEADDALTAANTTLRSAQDDAREVARLAREQIAAESRSARSGVAELGRRTRQEVDDAVAKAKEQAEAIAEASTNRVRGALPQVQGTNADALRESIRKEQLARGDESYREAFRLAAGADVSGVVPVLQSVIERNPVVARAYNNSVRSGGSTTFGDVAGKVDVDVPDLRTFDRMRQEVSDFVYPRTGEVGISRVQAREARQAIDALEKSYLDAMPPEASQALRAARAEYREYFNQLEALKDGRNLYQFGTGKAEGLIEASRLSLDTMERELAEMSPEALAAFQVGAREWVNDQLSKGTGNVLQVARRFVGTPERVRRTSLALGDEATEALSSALVDVQGRGTVQASVAGAREAGDEVLTAMQRKGREFYERTQALAREQVGDVRRLQADMLAPAQRGVERARQMGQEADFIGTARQAVGSPEVGQTFAQSILPRLSPAVQQRAGGVMGTAIERELANLPVPQALARIKELRANPGTNAVLGAALEQAERDLASRVPLRRRMGSVLGGAAGAGIFNDER